MIGDKKRIPATLATPTPRMIQTALTRLNLDLDRGCKAYCCDGSIATLTRRIIAGNVTIHLQCNTCGRSMASYKRAEHFNWQSYPEWNEAIREAFQFNMDELERARNAEWESRRDEVRTAYSDWLRTNPEWQKLRSRVAHRADYRCEACLVGQAVDIHHETYAMGKLPPAWALRAVCRDCHRRLHDGWREEDPG
jgi:hypothetical protein